jgi:hypothetical protein
MFVKRFSYPGALSGVLGAVAMALWFLAIDALRGEPFRTPAFLEAAILGRDAVSVGATNIVLYSVIHLALFALAGVAVAWLLGKIRAVPNVLAGLIVGFVLYEMVFYSSVSVTGVDIVGSLGWPEVLIGNLIAGVTMVGYLHMMGATPVVHWWSVMRRHHIVMEGIVSGLIGAAVVAVWFLIFDAVAGRPLFTPSALGSALFLGESGLDGVAISMSAVVGYSLVHLLAFAGMGLVASAVLTQAEEVPPLLLGAVLLFVAFEAAFMGFIALRAEFLLGPLAWTSIAFANVLAAGGMGYYLWRKHPRLRAAFAANPLDRTV